MALTQQLMYMKRKLTDNQIKMIILAEISNKNNEIEIACNQKKREREAAWENSDLKKDWESLAKKYNLVSSNYHVTAIFDSLHDGSAKQGFENDKMFINPDDGTVKKIFGSILKETDPENINAEVIRDYINTTTSIYTLSYNRS